MKNKEKMLQAIEKIDLVYNDELISKEHLIQAYGKFLCESFSEEKHNVSVVLHTGSVCFDVAAIAFAAISNLILNDNKVENVLGAISDGDIVTYNKQRYIFYGIRTEKFLGAPEEYVILEQEKNAQTQYVPQKLWNKITPYYGEAKSTGGKGVRKSLEKRNAFISAITGLEESDIPSIIDSSTVIVMSREQSDEILRNTKIIYNDNVVVKLLDLVTASYYTENDEYNYSGNAEKVDPILKIASKVDVARRLAKKRGDNRVEGVLVLEKDGATQSISELAELIERQSLGYVYVSYHINSELGAELANSYPDAHLFACTKEFLLQNSLPVKIQSMYTDMLEIQVEKIIDKQINTSVNESDFSWDDFKKIKRQIKNIKHTASINENKESFVIQASALLNLLVTAPFSLETMEMSIEELNVISPRDRLEELSDYANTFLYGMKDMAIEIIETLKSLYESVYYENIKEKALKSLLTNYRGEKIVIVVPKAYYINILQKTLSLYLGTGKVSIVTANKFDNEKLYDRVIVVGDIKGKRYNTFKCKSATDIDVLLYDYEKILFEHRYKKARRQEAEYDVRNKVIDIAVLDDFDKVQQEYEEVHEMDTISEELDTYYEKLNVIAMKNLVSRQMGMTAQTIEVTKVARFVEGESILFSKHYKAIVFDEEKEDVVEKNIEDLLPGDILIFTKNDDFTKNIVDDILEKLLEEHLLGEIISEAYRKSRYWKEVLRHYIEENKLSSIEVGKKFEALGSTKHHATIRSWVQPFSHIVGPKDEESYEHIALLTRDGDMMKNHKEYHEACRVIRSERTKILGFIAKAIIAKFSGNYPENDKILSVVFENVDELSIRMQIESITTLEEEYHAPVGMVNKPIVV